MVQFSIWEWREPRAHTGWTFTIEEDGNGVLISDGYQLLPSDEVATVECESRVALEGLLDSPKLDGAPLFASPERCADALPTAPTIPGPRSAFVVGGSPRPLGPLDCMEYGVQKGLQPR